MTTRHLYVDESKRRGYVMVASVHVGDHVETVEQLSIPVDRGVSGDLRFGVLIAV